MADKGPKKTDDDKKKDEKKKDEKKDETKDDKSKKDKDKPDSNEKEKEDTKPTYNNQKVPYHTVIVHPLVLLSVVDHYTRDAKNKRVVGILLGEASRGRVDITNSYAVPFEEDPKTPSIWYLDHNYHEEMFAMFKKVNARERVIGWYSTGPKIRAADLEINELIRRYTADPVMVIVDVNPKDELEIPTEAYVSMESKPEEKSQQRRTFVHLPSEIGAYEPEEVGVEHLLRNIRDIGGSTLSDQVKAKVNSLKGLKKRMEEMYEYLDGVCSGKFTPNHQIIYNIQDIFNLVPDLKVKELVQSFATNTNDNYLVIYLSSLVRSITALHDLINNKLKNRALEKEAAEGEKHTEEVKEKETHKKETEAVSDKDAEKKDSAKKDAKAEDKDKDKKDETTEDKDKKDKDKDKDKDLAASKKKQKKKRKDTGGGK